MQITKEEFLKLCKDGFVVFDCDATKNIITTRLIELIKDITKREIKYILFDSQFTDWFNEGGYTMVDRPFDNKIPKRHICIFKLVDKENTEYYNNMILGNY